MKDVKELMGMVDKYTPSEGKLAIHRYMNDGHEDEWTANHLISDMVPVAWLGVAEEPGCMKEYLAMLGVTPKSAKDMIEDAYEEAKSIGSKHDIDAPKPNANEWDCYWCIAMMLADYWVTHMGDVGTAAMLAYQYLSDPDR